MANSLAISKATSPRDGRDYFIGPVRVDRLLHDDLKRDAEELGVAMSEIIRMRLRGNLTKLSQTTAA